MIDVHNLTRDRLVVTSMVTVNMHTVFTPRTSAIIDLVQT